ncbi:DUF6929 family protein [Parapedobacter lycopersici]|uniref:DUF6929 family protein n=1 Tax=Parapedobacter lycopersici TaxID=1864939 RepID=UPI00214D9E51|nr:hypothetical protein [Parapedobacter lycopersici]
MSDFALKVVATIIGVGAASGLFFRDDSVYVISDDSNYLYRYSLSANTLSKVLLVADSLDEQLPKKQKRDFEAVAADGDRFYIYGSGSSDNGKRNLRIALDMEGRQPDTVEDVTHSYARLRELVGLTEDDFNLEGAIHRDGKVYLFNRGNGPNQMNGIFKLDAASRDTTFLPVELPELGGVRTAFTDAVAVGNTVYFLAAAEDTESVYHDGAVNGTLLGTLSLPDLTLEDYTLISDAHKFEGITFVAADTKYLTFFLCEDPDNGEQTTALYHLRVNR